MSIDSPPPDPQPGESRDYRSSVTTYVYDGKGQLAGVIGADGQGPMTHADPPVPPHWERIPDKRLFALTAEGRTEYCARQSDMLFGGRARSDHWYGQARPEKGSARLPVAVPGGARSAVNGQVITARGAETTTRKRTQPRIKRISRIKTEGWITERLSGPAITTTSPADRHEAARFSIRKIRSIRG